MCFPAAPHQESPEGTIRLWCPGVRARPRRVHHLQTWQSGVGGPSFFLCVYPPAPGSKEMKGLEGTELLGAPSPTCGPLGRGQCAKAVPGTPEVNQRAALATPPPSWVLRLALSFKLAKSKNLFQKPPGHPDWYQVRQLEGPLSSGAWAPAAGPPGNCSSHSARLCCGLEGGWPGGAGALSAVCSILESC